MSRLGALEASVMELLWSREDTATVRDVVESLRPQRVLAYTTVLTVLDNLHRKGLVEREKRGRAYHYRATGTGEGHAATLMREALEGAADRSGALLRFVERLDADQLAELRLTMDRLSSERDGTPGT